LSDVMGFKLGRVGGSKDREDPGPIINPAKKGRIIGVPSAQPLFFPSKREVVRMQTRKTQIRKHLFL